MGDWATFLLLFPHLPLAHRFALVEPTERASTCMKTEGEQGGQMGQRGQRPGEHGTGPGTLARASE